MKNMINAALIDEAIFGILRREEVAVGGWVRLSALSRMWLLTGLRHADLVEGLARLDTNGFLHLEGQDEAFAILCRRPPFFRPRMIGALRTLRRTRARPRSGVPVAERRNARSCFVGDRAAA